MIILEECKRILNKEKKKYTEEEIKQIREYLYLIGHIEIENNEEKFYNNERNTIHKS